MVPETEYVGAEVSVSLASLELLHPASANDRARIVN